MEPPNHTSDQQASRDRDTAKAQAPVSDLAMRAERLGLTLPTAFTRLMPAPDLLDRIPEYACCWFNHGEALPDPCPGSGDEFIVRFMNDQQDCILWYLYLTRRGDEAVLAVGEPYPDAPSNYLERLVRPDENGPVTDEQQRAVLANTCACAPGFEAIVYWWRLEATIYMKLNGHDSAPLTEQERRYLAHYQQRKRAL